MKTEKMGNRSFSAVFFQFYDRKIRDGVITFSQLGMKKEDFTRLCTDDSFVPDQETVEKLCFTMKLTEEERFFLLEAAGYETKNIG